MINPKMKILTLQEEVKRLKKQNMELILLCRAHCEALIKSKDVLETCLNDTGDKFMESEAIQSALNKEDYKKEDEFEDPERLK